MWLKTLNDSPTFQKLQASARIPITHSPFCMGAFNRKATLWLDEVAADTYGSGWI